MKLPDFGLRRGLANLFSLSAHNLIIRRVNALLMMEVKMGERQSFVVSDHNSVLTIPRTSGSGAAGAGVALRCAVLDVSAEDTISCIILDGDDAGTVISVARPELLKASIDSEIYEPGALEITVAFTYSDTQTRTAASSGYVTHTQKILPKYHERVMVGEDIETEGSILYVMATESGYIDLNVDAREWQAIPYIPVP